LTIGSANFPENVLLADIYASALTAKGIKVNTKFNVGSREILYKQVSGGSLSVLPEYNGALLAYLDKSTTATSTEEINTRLDEKLPPELELLDSASAQDTNALVVTGDTARRDGLASIADLAPYASAMDLGGPPEFQTRQEGLPGLKEKYGLTFKSFKALDTAGPITVKALSDGTVQAATLFTTDPKIAVNGFAVLTDPKHVFAAQNVTPLTYRASLDEKSIGVLNAVSAKLDTPALAGIMREVLLDKKDIDVVADAWLRSVGLR